MRTIFTYIFLLLVISGAAQKNNSYQAHLSTGNLPDEFSSTFYKNYIKQRNDITLDKRRKDRMYEDQFYKESNHWVYDIQISGEVLYGGLMQDYVNTVMANILNNDTTLKRKVKVFIVRSSALNAFSTDRGNVYVNIGLLARIRTEAELAFILSHELVHYLKKHCIKAFLNFNKDAITTGVLYEDSLIKIHNYSQSLEFEADTLGFHYFLNSPYNLKGAEDAMHLLFKADEPIYSTPFNYDFLSMKENSYQWTAFKTVDTSSVKTGKISIREADSISSHPALISRLNILKRFVEKYTAGAKPDFIQDKDLFLKVKKNAAFEMIDIYVEKHDPINALYSCSNIKNEYVDTNYFESVFVSALWDCLYEKLSGNFRNYEYVLKDSSEINKMLLRFMSLGNDEFFSLCLYHSYSLCKKYEFLSGTLNSKMNAGILYYKKSITPERFENLKTPNRKDSTWLKDHNAQCSDRIDSILLKDPFIQNICKRELQSKILPMAISEVKHLAPGNFLVQSSTFLYLNYRNNDPLDLKRSELNKIKFEHFLERKGSVRKRKVTTLSPYLKKGMDISAYNDYVTVNRIIDDYIYHDGKLLLTTNLIDSIRIKNNCRYILWNYNVSYTQTLANAPSGIQFYILRFLGTFICAPCMPTVLTRDALGTNGSILFSVLIDTKTYSCRTIYYPLEKNISSFAYTTYNTKKLLRK